MTTLLERLGFRNNRLKETPVLEREVQSPIPERKPVKTIISGRDDDSETDAFEKDWKFMEGQNVETTTPKIDETSRIEDLELTQALGVIGLKPGANFYQILEAYNWRLIQLNPIGTDGSVEELETQRKAVWDAYKTIKANLKRVEKLSERKLEVGQRTLERLVRATENDKLPVHLTPTEIKGQLPAGDVGIYDFYIDRLRKMKQVLDKSNPAEFYQGPKTKMVEHGRYLMNDTYYHPQLEALAELKKEGFLSQKMPGATAVEIIDGTLIYAPNGWWAVEEQVERNSKLENQRFSFVARFKTINSEKAGGRFLLGGVSKTEIYGITNVDFEKLSSRDRWGECYYASIYRNLRNPDMSTTLFAYLIGTTEPGEVQKNEAEKKSEGRINLYKSLFGFEPPSDADFEKLLRTVHHDQLDPRKKYQMVSRTPAQLSYPLMPEVLDIFRAARDSKAFDDVAFLEMVEEERLRPRAVDPILYGTILGGLKVPLCYWK